MNSSKKHVSLLGIVNEMQLEKIIGDLLLRHNCVIVPGFGGFVAQPMPSTIDYPKGIIYPPNKSLLFNQQLISNDGLLVSEYSIRQKLTYDQAYEQVQKYVTVWNAQLSVGKRIHIERIGYLFIDSEKQIAFKQDKQFNLLLSSYGLSQVKFFSESAFSQIHPSLAASIEKTQWSSDIHAQRSVLNFVVSPDTPIVGIHSHEQVSDFAHNRNTSNIWKHIVVASIFPILFYTFWIPLKTDVLESKIISFNDLNPFHQHAVPQYAPKSIANILPNLSLPSPTLNESIKLIETNDTTYPFKLTEDTYILVKVNHPHAKNQDPTKITQTNSVQAKSNAQNHTIKKVNYIVGCFSLQENAKKLVTELNGHGIQAFIYDKKGALYRVSAGEFNSLQELQQTIAQTKQLGYSGWTLK